MRRWRPRLGLLLAVALAADCQPPAEQQGKPAAATLIIGLDVSGSFRDAKLYDDAVQFAALYIYSHLNSLDHLKPPTALFFGPVGGARPGETKPFRPINDFQGRTPDQIASDIRGWFPATDAYTDFNVFFQRVAELIKERGLILAPVNVVVLSDGIPDVPPGTRLAAGQNPYTRISVDPLEFLSRSMTVRLLYASPSVGENWKKLIRHKRVRMWTQEAQVMAGWHKQYKPDLPIDRQDALWQWIADNVDFRARAGNLF